MQRRSLCDAPYLDRVACASALGHAVLEGGRDDPVLLAEHAARKHGRELEAVLAGLRCEHVDVNVDDEPAAGSA